VRKAAGNVDPQQLTTALACEFVSFLMKQFEDVVKSYAMRGVRVSENSEVEAKKT